MDLLDRAFVHHTQKDAERPRAHRLPAAHETASVVAPVEPASESAPESPRDPQEAIWDGVAATVEQAVWQGRTVIAVTAAERGVGASTIAVGLARALDRRGHRMAVLHGSPRQPGYYDDLCELAATHDAVLVDPGPWFGSGRLRREQLARVSHGCHAAIVVRRECGEAMPGVEAAMEAVGIDCLGEVLTFAEAAAMCAGDLG